MTATIVLVRHGETQPNVDGTLLGRRDVELTDRGRAQVDALAVLLAPEDVRAVVSSPLRRATATAAGIAAPHGLEVVTDDRWIELDYGDWEGRGLAALDAAESARWRRDPGFAPPRGESLVRLQARVAAACRDLSRDDGLVIVVSHVSPIKAAVSWALDVGPEIAWRTHLRVAAVSRIVVRDGRTALLTFGETSHL